MNPGENPPDHAMSPRPGFISLRPYQPGDEPLTIAQRFFDVMRQRRSVRSFSDRPVSREVIENLIRAAGTAPSGANKQPWRFVAVSDPALKRDIRIAAEEEERLFYDKRASEVWKRDLYPLGTDWRKPFLEIAPWLIVVFKLMKDPRGLNSSPPRFTTNNELGTTNQGSDAPSLSARLPGGEGSDAPSPPSPLPGGEGSEGRISDQVYYVNESVGIAVGFLLAAAHHAGLCALTHTPSPMKFLATILGRPEYERPYLLIPLGHPAEDCPVPDIQRKTLEEILVVHESPPERRPANCA